jgi:dTDP-L-rhamnose 4-epimerase
MRALITGGAGFIGSHLADALLARGDHVRLFDNLEIQVHGAAREWPAYLDARAERVLGDVRDRQAVGAALRGVDVVYHLAAATGVGQSMYQIAKYFEVNVQGTAHLLDALAGGDHSVGRLILASSRAVYGEGAYDCDACGSVHPNFRTPEQLDRAVWEPICPECGATVSPAPTPETLSPDPGSMYAITKLCQEQMCVRFGEAYAMPVIVLRLFNVYGPGQSLDNPYAGIVTAFANRLMSGSEPQVYEDGLMTRDFVHVSDAVRALTRASVGGSGAGALGSVTINIGSGRGRTLLELATRMCALLAPDLRPQVTGFARVGDVRHCTADVRRARDVLAWEAEREFAWTVDDLGAARTRGGVESAQYAGEELRSHGGLRRGRGCDPER